MGRPTKTLDEQLAAGTFRPDRHAELVPDERPDFIDLTSWIRLLRRVGRKVEARALVRERIREHQAAKRQASN